MTESSLALGYTDLRLEIANYLGLTRTSGSWSSDETDMLEVVLKRALRQFYFPAPVNEEGRGRQTPHQWSFLKPVTELVTIAPYSTGTIAITITETTVTLTNGTWPSWTATHGSLVVDTTEYAIASRTNDTELELVDAWTATTETDSTFVLKHDGNYDLPDDFGGIEGNLVIESVNHMPNITLIGEGRIRSMRQTFPQDSEASSSVTMPYYAAVRPKEHTDTTVGQRFEIMFFPLPNDVLTISYVKRILPQALVETSLEYPYGGAEHSETILAACLSVAEEQENGNRLGGSPVYDKKNLFEERLAASIALDKRKNGTEYFGYNFDRSDLVHRDDPRTRRTGFLNNTVQYSP